jgi:hypothetical protein
MRPRASSTGPAPLFQVDFRSCVSARRRVTPERRDWSGGPVSNETFSPRPRPAASVPDRGRAGDPRLLRSHGRALLHFL